MMQELQAFKFTVEHVPGSKIQVAVSLSRIPNRPCKPSCSFCTRIELQQAENTKNLASVHWTQIFPDPGVTPMQMRKDQALDENLMELVAALTTGEPRPPRQEIVGCSAITRSLWHQYESLVLIEGILYRRYEHPSRDPAKNVFQLILPRKHVEATVSFYHGEKHTAQHYGRTKTLLLLKRFFYWPNMFFDVYRIVAACTVCFATKGPHSKSKPPLLLYRDNVLHARWQIDFCGPFVQSKAPEKYRYILVCVESFSSWPVAIPTRTQTAVEVAEKLIEHVFSVFGCPDSIHSDMGRSFEAQVFQEVMKLYGIKKTHSTAFNPRSNGKVEIFIKVLKQHLCMLVQENQKDWPQHLPIICQTYRSLPLSSSSYSPYEIMFGSHMKMPIDLVRGKPPTVPPTITSKKFQDYPIQLRQRLWHIHEAVRTSIDQAGRKMKYFFDKTANCTEFEPGAKVWLYTPTQVKGRSSKLQKHWSGPWIVVNKINDCVYRIRSEKEPRKLQLVSPARLAPFHSTTQ